MLRLRNREDLGAGFMLIVAAGLFLVFARDLSHGSLAQMGPGYLPRYVAVMLMGIGAVLLFRGLRRDGLNLPRITPRAVVVPALALVVFGLAIEPLGLAIASFLAVVIGALAHPGQSWPRTSAMAVLLAVGSCVLFVTLLDLPLPVLPSVLR
ncbi:putative tricarboxylic transport membrane protein [Hyphomicrobiales bacterium]|jgi:hypothetical protein|nr:putative tricarboxylic transport membrane protein [Hyphomicrobiales bacterium]